MISVRRAELRRHVHRRRRDVWCTFEAPDRFGSLEAIDENRLRPGAELPSPARDELEIVTYVRDGALAFQDSLGHSGVIQAGEFQRTRAARGLWHTEASRSNWAHAFQIGLRPSEPELEPACEQGRFSTAERRNVLRLIASPDARGGSLRLLQDTRMYSSILEPGQHVVHELAPERAAWLHVMHGEVTLGDLVLTAGDGVSLTTERAVSLTARRDTEILLFDLAARPLHEEVDPS